VRHYGGGLDLGDPNVRATVRRAATAAVELDAACREMQEGNRLSLVRRFGALINAHQAAERAVERLRPVPRAPKPEKPAPELEEPKPSALAEHVAAILERKRARANSVHCHTGSASSAPQAIID
jgi:hypothetical protein